MPDETELAMTRRHVREGEAHVARQREIVNELSDHGHDTVMAETLLAEFESTLRDHRAHLARLLAAGAR
jgi:hypothetical protein